MLSLFDFPDPNAHAERRANTTTALQKLFVLHSTFMLEQARGLANSAGPSPGSLSEVDLRAALDHLYLRVFARSPHHDEANLMTEYLLSGLSTADFGQLQARWIEVSHVLLASNELLFCD